MNQLLLINKHSVYVFEIVSIFSNQGSRAGNQLLLKNQYSLHALKIV